MRCLTCYWWAGEEDEMDRCYGMLPRILREESIYGEWPLTSENDRCPKYRRDVGKTVIAWYWAILRWWYARSASSDV